MSMKIGCIIVSDAGEEQAGDTPSSPVIEDTVRRIFPDRLPEYSVRIVPAERQRIELALVELTDAVRCELVITLGGIGPSHRDVTPEATKTVINRELPGFGEIMRVKSFDTDPAAAISRATAGVRNRSLIVNLPGEPRAMHVCLIYLGAPIREAVRRIRGE